jgi:hypothetical protein
MVRTAIILAVWVCITAEAFSQDTIFVPSVRYDQESGNFIISYDRDAATGRVFETVFVPPTKIFPELQCTVQVADGKFAYDYLLTNKPRGRQSIFSFDLERPASLDSFLLPVNWFYRPSRSEPFLHVVHYGDSGNVEVSQQLQFGTISSGVPGIILSRFYGQEETLSYVFGTEPTYVIQHLIDSLERIPGNRCVSRKTVGPITPPDPFVALTFLDTLNSITTQSRYLAWIKDQPTADKYLTYFSSARGKLVQGDSVGARAVLQQVLRDVDIDSTANLTSEAYALLKYNTEYLVDKLPQR